MSQRRKTPSKIKAAATEELAVLDNEDDYVDSEHCVVCQFERDIALAGALSEQFEAEWQHIKDNLAGREGFEDALENSRHHFYKHLAELGVAGL